MQRYHIYKWMFQNKVLHQKMFVHNPLARDFSMVAPLFVNRISFKEKAYRRPLSQHFVDLSSALNAPAGEFLPLGNGFQH